MYSFNLCVLTWIRRKSIAHVMTWQTGRTFKDEIHTLVAMILNRTKAFLEPIVYGFLRLIQLSAFSCSSFLHCFATIMDSITVHLK